VADRLRSTQLLLQQDLLGTTARMVPPLRPEENLGYFEIIEGPIGPVLPLRPYDSNGDGSPDGYDLQGTFNNVDIEGTTLGDFDDVLMFTSRNMKAPFRGNAGNSSISSPVAEVIWFLRGTTLYRRVLLVAPGVEGSIPSADLQNSGFYGNYDLSVHAVGGPNDRNALTTGVGQFLALNTLGDLTKRENRYGHQPFVFPHDARFWGLLGMPTLQECSFYSDTSDPTTGLWPFPLQNGVTTFDSTFSPLIVPAKAYDGMIEYIEPMSISVSSASSVVPGYATSYVGEHFQHEDTIINHRFEPWFNPFPWDVVDPSTSTLKAYDVTPFTTATGYYPNGGGNAGSTRVAEDVVMTNVLAFDIKVWDPGAPVLEHKPSATAPPVSVLPGDPDYIPLLNAAKGTMPNYPNPPTSGQTFIASFGAYVDLNYMCRLGQSVAGINVLVPNYDITTTTLSNIGAPQPWFHGPGDPRSQLMGTPPNTAPSIANALASVYDSWSTHYEYDGIDQDGDGRVDEGTDGFDNTVTTSPFQHGTGTGGVNGIDDFNELEAAPPYAFPLKGVQITIRAFDPDSRQVREVTIVQDFQAAASGTNY